MADKKVVVYSTPTCPYCKMAKDYLTKKGISFTEYDVIKDEEAAREMIEKLRQMSVPVIIIDGDIVAGFNQELIDKLLAK
jgi:glutaredoxin 3